MHRNIYLYSKNYFFLQCTIFVVHYEISQVYRTPLRGEHKTGLDTVNGWKNGGWNVCLLHCQQKPDRKSSDQLNTIAWTKFTGLYPAGIGKFYVKLFKQFMKQDNLSDFRSSAPQIWCVIDIIIWNSILLFLTLSF